MKEEERKNSGTREGRGNEEQENERVREMRQSTKERRKGIIEEGEEGRRWHMKTRMRTK